MPIEHLPSTWRPSARRLRRWAMTDSMAALILGCGALLRGCSYIPGVLGAPPSSGSHPAEMTLPIGVWGWVWIAAGVACVLSSLAPLPRTRAVALSVGVALHVMWGGSFLAATWAGESPRSWVSAISYCMVAALVLWAVWRGKRGDMPMAREMGGANE